VNILTIKANIFMTFVSPITDIIFLPAGFPPAFLVIPHRFIARDKEMDSRRTLVPTVLVEVGYTHFFSYFVNKGFVAV